MRTITTKEELKKAIKNKEREVIVLNDNLLKSLAVVSWIQKNKVKGAALLAAITGLTVGTAGIGGLALSGIVGTGLVVGGLTISTTELLIIAALIITIIALCRDYDATIDVNSEDKTVSLKYNKSK